MNRPVMARGAALVALVALALVLGVRGMREAQRAGAAQQVCDAAAARAWSRALELSAAVQGQDDAARTAAECACAAWLATGREAECAGRLQELAHAAPDAPLEPALVPVLVRHLLATRQTADAQAVVNRAAALHPLHEGVLEALLDVAEVTGRERETLEELVGRVPAADPASSTARAVLASRLLRREDPDAALRALGAPPPLPDTAWFHTRARALGALGRANDVADTFAAYVRAGGAPADALSRHALVATTHNLDSPQHPLGELLVEACRHLGEGVDGEVAATVAYRTVLSLAAAGRVEQARALVEQVRPHAALPGDILAQVDQTAAARGARAAGAGGTVVFEPVAGVDHLLLSPPPGAAADAPHVRVSLQTAQAVTRGADVRPLRWVARDARERAVASGSVWPGQAGTVGIRPGPAAAPAALELPPRPAGDGRRRVFVLVLDCADWRIIRHLQARGELPVLTALMDQGMPGVLHSEPAYTAAAMEALTQPQATGARSVLGTLHHLGEELASNDALAGNPLAVLEPFLPPQQDLVSVLSAGPLRVANVLFSHGNIRAGRNATVTGPGHRQQSLALGASQRPLTPQEAARHPGLGGPTAALAQQMSAVLDAAVTLAADRTLDVVLLRVDALDTITHAHLGAVFGAGQDDGNGFLFAAYRLADERVLQVVAALDADDALLLMSDHGITTPMVHSEDALLVAWGLPEWKGAPRSQGDLRGLPWVLAHLLGVEVPWAHHGLARWFGRNTPQR